MKCILYTKEEKIVIKEEELGNVDVIEDYKNGIVKVVYNGKFMYFIDNPNYTGRNIFIYEDIVIEMLYFIDAFKVPIDELFKISELIMTNRIRFYLFFLMFNFKMKNISFIEKIENLFTIPRLMLSFFGRIRSLKKFLES